MAATTSAAEQLRQRLGLELLLYDDPHSEFCAKVKVALHHKGLTWQALAVKPCGGDGAVSTDFQTRVPLGKIPALVILHRSSSQPGDQTEAVLHESEVINEWLEDQFPEPPLLPADALQRSKARLISRFHDLYLEPALRKLYPQVRPAARDRATVEAAGREFCTRLQQLEAMLIESSEPSSGGGGGGGGSSGGGKRYAVGEALTLADCGYPALLLYAELIFPAVGLGRLDYGGVPRVAAWRQALWGDESVAKVLRELQPAAQAWVDSKVASL